MALVKSLGVTLYWTVLLCCFAVYLNQKRVNRKKQIELSLRHQCQPITHKYSHKEPFFGLDIFIENSVAAYRHKFLETITRRQHQTGETFQLNFLGLNGKVQSPFQFIQYPFSSFAFRVHAPA